MQNTLRLRASCALVALVSALGAEAAAQGALAVGEGEEGEAEEFGDVMDDVGDEGVDEPTDPAGVAEEAEAPVPTRAGRRATVRGPRGPRAPRHRPPRYRCPPGRCMPLYSADAAPSTAARVEASFGKGVTIHAADDSLSLNVRGRMQLRATVLDTPEDGQDPNTEVTVRRLRLAFGGHALSPKLTYRVQLAFSNLDTEPDLRLPLRDAYITWEPLRDVSLRFGQKKVAYTRQRLISSSALQMVDRSIVLTELNLDRDVGMEVFSKDLFGLGGHLGYVLGVYGGSGRNRLGREHGLLYVARLEGRPFGKFNDFVEADMAWEPKPRLSLGMGAAYNQNTDRPRSTTGDPYPSGDFDYLHLGADLVFKFSGFSLQGEVMIRKADQDSRGVDIDGEASTIYARSARGAYVQAGQMLLDEVEVTARYGRFDPLGDHGDPSLVRSDELGGGLNYYVSKHNLKVQGDYFYLPTGSFDGGAHQGRVQAQLFF